MRNGSLNGKPFQRFLQFGALFIILASVAAHLSWTKSPAAARHAIREMHLSYAFTVKGIPSETNRVGIWLPVPKSDARQRFLAPDRLVQIDGKIAGEAKKVVRDDMTPLENARAIYDHVATTVTYDKSPTNRGWGRGDAIYACDVRTGNCTDFHSLFIGMARASGIPARFVMGFPVPEGVTEGEIPGYHCWAEFYIDGMGWLPIDASEASKHPEKWNDLFGGLDPHRVQFTVGRDIRVPSMRQSEPLNYFIYPYVLVDGKPHGEVQRHVRFSELAD